MSDPKPKPTPDPPAPPTYPPPPPKAADMIQDLGKNDPLRIFRR